MVWHPTKDAVKRLWGRRWVRRISYTLVAGATTLTVVPWAITRPTILQWAMKRLDGKLREETGLTLTTGRVEFFPLLGHLVLHDVRLGEDLLTVKRVEIQADILSLIGPTPRIYSLRVEHPHLRLTEAGLSAIRLKSPPKEKKPLPQIRLDFFSLTSGEIQIPEPLRGIPALQYQFDMKATGLGPNHVRVDLAGPQLAVKGPGGWERGRLDLNGEASEPRMNLREAYLRLGGTQIRMNGRYEASVSPTAEQVEARLSGILDLAQTARWGGMPRPPIEGGLDLLATLKGSLRHLVWTFSGEGQDLRPTLSTLLPGSLRLRGEGGLQKAHLDQLLWSSSQGDLEIQGEWTSDRPIWADVRGQNLDLEALGGLLYLDAFQGVRGKLQAQVRGPADLEQRGRLDRWQASLKTTLSRDGLDAGGIEATLHQGRAALSRLKVDLESLKLDGQGWATLGPRSLVQMEGSGRLDTSAGRLARTLARWKVADLDMDGRTTAEAEVQWHARTGLHLEGRTSVNQPRWHGATADSLRAKVDIKGSDLWVKDIDLRKGEGHGGGDLWLTWADTPPGQNQVDMCYTATRLPVAEGLRAADLKDAEGTEYPLAGRGSGWVRIQGPFSHLTMSGAAQVESGEAYGISIPAASSDFEMDLETLHLKLSGLRIAERPDFLNHGDVPPEGALALLGRADMDFLRWIWWVDLGGRMDSQWLALPGPRFQSQAEIRLLGPITSPFGQIDLPEGKITLSRGRLFFGDKSLEGIEGDASLERGLLKGSLGIEGMTHPLLGFLVHRDGPDLAGTLDLSINPDSVHTESLARSLTDDLLEDLNLLAKAQGRWTNGRDLAWSGSLDSLSAQFNAFTLHQSRPSILKGDALGVMVDLTLEGGARGPDGAAATQAAQVRLSGQLPFLASTPMAVKAQGSADLTHLKSILDRFMEVDEYSLLSELRVEGTSRFDLLAHGTYPQPQMDGTLALSNGQLHLRRYQGVENLEAEVVFKNRTLAIQEDKPLRGTLADGELKVFGAATWAPGGLEAYALQASLSGFQLRDVPDGLDLQGSLNASLDGTEEGGLLKGTLSADRLSYQTEVKLADLILRSALGDSGGLVGLDLDDPLERIRLDLDLDLQAPWSFDTNLLKLEGRTEGSFQVLGTLGHPVPKGTLRFQPGGRITNIFPAGDMVVDRGSLSFSESRPLDPLINLQGSVSSIPGYTVNLDIHGTLSNLAIVPSSTPSLRQDEVVAILINPGNVANVGSAGASGATQGAITSGVASAGSGLISTLAFTPLQEQLRRTLGLDRVNVAVRTSSLGTAETEVTMGKSINLLGQRSALVLSHRKSGELSITSGQVEWRFGGFILHLGASKGGGSGINPSGEIRHTWSPR